MMSKRSENPVVNLSQVQEDDLKRHCPLRWSQREEHRVSSAERLTDEENFARRGHEISAPVKEHHTSRSFSRLKKRRRTTTVPTSANPQDSICSPMISKAWPPCHQPNQEGPTTQSIESDVTHQTLKPSLSADLREDYLPGRATSVGRLLVDFAKQGYQYGFQYCRPLSRIGQYCLSARFRCLKHKPPQKCTASFTAKLRSGKSEWETKGILKHNHPRLMLQPNELQDRLKLISKALSRNLPKDETLPCENRKISPPPLLLAASPTPMPTAEIIAPFIPTTRSIGGPLLQHSVSSSTLQSRIQQRIPSHLTASPTPLSSSLVCPTALTPQQQNTSRSLPLLAPRPPYVFLTPSGPVMVSPPLLPRVPAAQSYVSTRRRKKEQRRTK